MLVHLLSQLGTSPLAAPQRGFLLDVQAIAPLAEKDSRLVWNSNICFCSTRISLVYGTLNLWNIQFASFDDSDVDPHENIFLHRPTYDIPATARITGWASMTTPRVADFDWLLCKASKQAQTSSSIHAKFLWQHRENAAIHSSFSLSYTPSLSEHTSLLPNTDMLSPTLTDTILSPSLQL
jgi:hypothetical protein